MLIDPLLPWQRIRVVGFQGKAWQVNPVIEQAHVQQRRLWLWEGKALTEVDWDPGEWQWPPIDPSQGRTPFFSYNARLGRLILGMMQSRSPTQQPKWHAQGISKMFV